MLQNDRESPKPVRQDSEMILAESEALTDWICVCHSTESTIPVWCYRTASNITVQ